MSPRAISAAYLERKLRAITGVQGGNPIPDLVDLTGFITIEADRPEWSAAGGEGLIGHREEIAAVVGEVGVYGWLNPSNSGQLLVMERIRAVVAAAAYATIWLLPQASLVGTTTDVVPFRDTRMARGVLGNGSGIIAHFRTIAGGVAGLAGAVAIGAEGANTGSTSHPSIPTPLVIEPGFAWMMDTSLISTGVLQTNALLVGSASGRTRPLEGLFEVK